jgi:hypothetical protein
MLTRKLTLAVMMLALSSVAAVTSTATDGAKGKRLMTHVSQRMHAHKCAYENVRLSHHAPLSSSLGFMGFRH